MLLGYTLLLTIMDNLVIEILPSYTPSREV